MDAAQIVCDACGARFRWKAALAGRRVNCSMCRTPILVPQTAEAAAARVARYDASASAAGKTSVMDTGLVVEVLDRDRAKRAAAEQAAAAAAADEIAKRGPAFAREMGLRPQQAAKPGESQTSGMSTAAGLSVLGLDADDATAPAATPESGKMRQHGGDRYGRDDLALVLVVLTVLVTLGLQSWLAAEVQVTARRLVREAGGSADAVGYPIGEMLMGWLIGMAMLFAVAVPVLMLGILATGRVMRFHLRRSAYVSTAGWVCVPLLCSLAGYFIGGADTAMLLGVAGLLPAFPAFKWFHGVSWAEAFAGYLASLAGVAVFVAATLLMAGSVGMAVGDAFPSATELAAGHMPPAEEGAPLVATTDMGGGGVEEVSVVPPPPKPELPPLPYEPDEAEPLPVEAAVPPLPAFTGMANMELIEPGVLFEEIRIAGDGPGGWMKLWLYLPTPEGGEHADASLPLVLIAPAGTNSLTGQKLSGGDRPEHLPYPRAGIAAMAYELDGPIPAHASDAEIANAMRRFRLASGGVVNLRNAMEFALQRLPMIDPQRIYAVGHSSAGTIALAAAATEPRLAGVIAHAPISDLRDQLGREGLDALRRIDPAAIAFVDRLSPKLLVGRVTVPILLTQSTQDLIVAPLQTTRYEARLAERGKPVDRVTFDRGDHYSAMLHRGVPAGIAWIASDRQTAEPSPAVRAAGALMVGEVTREGLEAALEVPMTPAGRAAVVPVLERVMQGQDEEQRRLAARALARWDAEALHRTLPE